MSYHDISQDHEHGFLDGYVVEGTAENLLNYLEEFDFSAAEAIAGFARDRRLTVAILKDLRIDEGHRGAGIGTALFEAGLEAACGHGADLLVLVADTVEENAFDLLAWYEGYDFLRITPTHSGMVMAAGESAEALMKHVASAFGATPTPDALIPDPGA